MSTKISKGIKKLFDVIKAKHEVSEGVFKNIKQLNKKLDELTFKVISIGRGETTEPVFTTQMQRKFEFRRLIGKDNNKEWVYKIDKKDIDKYKDITNCNKREKAKQVISHDDAKLTKSFKNVELGDSKFIQKSMAYLQYITGRRITELLRPFSYKDGKVVFSPLKKGKEGPEESFEPLTTIEEVKKFKARVPNMKPNSFTRKINRFLKTAYGDTFHTHIIRALYANEMLLKDTSGASRADVISKALNHKDKSSVVCYDYIEVEKKEEKEEVKKASTSKKVKCEDCGVMISKSGFSAHKKTAKHKRNMGQSAERAKQTKITDFVTVK